MEGGERFKISKPGILFITKPNPQTRAHGDVSPSLLLHPHRVGPSAAAPHCRVHARGETTHISFSCHSHQHSHPSTCLNGAREHIPTLCHCAEPWTGQHKGGR